MRRNEEHADLKTERQTNSLFDSLENGQKYICHTRREINLRTGERGGYNYACCHDKRQLQLRMLSSSDVILLSCNKLVISRKK